MGTHRIALPLAPWILMVCALVVVAPWDWLPLATCGPWLVAVIWAILRSADGESPTPPSYAEAARRRLTVQ